MLNWIKRLGWITKLAIAGCLALALFLGYQTWTNYLKGIEGNPWQTVTRVKVVKVLEPAPLKKNEERRTYRVPIQAIVDKAQKDDQNKESLQIALDTEQNSLQLRSPSGEPQPKYPLLIQRYQLSETLFSGSILEVYLQEDGSVETKVSYKAPIVELGKLREVGLWVGPEIQAGDLERDHTGWSADLSYQQDLFRLGPSWTRLRAETGYSSILGAHAKIQIGIPVLRF